MRLLLVDDHALFREGMELVLRHLDPQTQVFHADNVPDALQVLHDESQIDLVLLDLHMPGMVGLDALFAVRERVESPAVVVLSGSEDTQMVWQAIDAGAMGFIQKQTDSRTMMTALRVVLEGGIYLPASCLTEPGRRGPAVSRDAPARERMASLGISSRQGEVLGKMAQGKPNKTIARELGITEATVKSHLSAAFAVLEVHSRTEAMYAMAHLGLRLPELDS